MFRFFLVVAVLFVATLALADSKDAAVFMRDMQIVFGDEKCEKAIKRYALNCPSKDKDRIKKCVKFESERTECLEKNQDKNENMKGR